jgi:hypothetical protein
MSKTLKSVPREIVALADAIKKLALSLVSQPVTETLGSVPGSIIALANAIKQFEGWYPGSRAYKNNNPGNLKDADGRLVPEKDWADDWGAYKLDDKSFYVFGTAEQGFAALVHLLQVRVRQHPEWSILNLFFSYAPPSENDTATYAAFVAKRVGGDVNTKLGDLV